MEEVEIKNVGGIRGVASEATLQLLVDTIKAQGTGRTSGTDQTTVTRLQTMYNKSVKDSTSEQKKFTEKLKDATDTVKDFSKELLIYGDRLSDFANVLFGNNSVLTRFVSYVDRTVDQFRELSSVGASFNNSMFDMIRSSGEAAMNLDDFVSMVRNNSQELARFGGTVTRGAQFIGEFSRDIRLGIGARFFDMGMTIDQVNEGLIGYLTLETMRGRRNLRNDTALQSSAANYIMQLDRLSKLTGQQRDALMESQIALQTDAQVRNQIARVERSRGAAAAEELRSIYTLQRETLPGFHSALMDLSDGVAQTDLARVLQQMAPGLTEFQQAVARGDVTQEEYLQAMQSRFIPAIERYAGNLDDSTLQTMRGLGGFYGALAEAVDSSYQFSNILNLNSREALAEQARRDRVTSTLGRFEQGLIAFRKFLFTEFINSPFATRLGELGEELVALFDENSPGSLSSAGRMLRGFFNRLFGDNGMFTNGLVWISNFIRSDEFEGALTWFGDKIQALGNWFNGFITSVRENGFIETLQTEFGRFIDYLFGSVNEATGNRSGGALANLYSGSWLQDAVNNMIDYLFGEIVYNMQDPNEPGTRQGGLFDRLFSDQGVIDGIVNAFTNLFETIAIAFRNFWDGDSGRDIKDSIEMYFRDVMLRLLRILDNIPFVDLTNEVNSMLNDARNRLRAGEQLSPGEAELLRSELTQRRQGLAGGIDGPLDRLFTSDEEMALTQRFIDEIDADLERLTRGGYARGTNGFENFGPATLTTLHNTEAVVPRNSPAGELLNAFYEMQQSGQSATTSSGSFNQPGVLDKLNELNSNVIRLVSVMQEGVTAQQKTVKNIRGLGTDMFRGAGV